MPDLKMDTDHEDRPIYVVSGGTGASGEQVVRTALAQFREADAPVVVVPHVRSAVQLEQVVAEAAASQGTVVHTLVDAGLRDRLIQLAHEHNVEAVDLIGGLLSRLTTLLGREPIGQPGLYRQLREAYFERVEAIEFTVAHDDGRNLDGLHRAEIVLVGVSRTGKTPLSMYLSVQGWKVANVPLIAEIEPPPELFAIDPRRVVGLTIAPGQLVAHRKWRQRHLGVGAGGSYSDPTQVFAEVEMAQDVFRRGGFAVVDITDKPIEESAAQVAALVSRYMG
ncbi:MAG: kinase/pyrophosphorylase [Anaerolineae bacterium]|nr:kinase/pyrophosphorylase [Anaerolineae bacterium]